MCTKRAKVNEGAKSCWEYWNCKPGVRDKCDAFKYKLGKYCWFVTGKDMKPIAARSFDSCWQCPWFKKWINGIYENGE